MEVVRVYRDAAMNVVRILTCAVVITAVLFASDVCMCATGHGSCHDGGEATQPQDECCESEQDPQGPSENRCDCATLQSGVLAKTSLLKSPRLLQVCMAPARALIEIARFAPAPILHCGADLPHTFPPLSRSSVLLI